MPQIIFNSLEGEKFVAALRCLSSFGRFFNFGKEDIENNRQIGLLNLFYLNFLFQRHFRLICVFEVQHSLPIDG